MKKALYLSVATVMLFAMSFIGCDDGVQENLNQQKYPALSAPQNLKATAQPGFIALGWDVVKDANDGYEVYRADATTKESKLLGTPTVPYLLDKVGFNNQLVDGRAYTYTVVAKGRNIGDYAVLDGKASTKATANIPARSAGAFTAAEAIKDIAHTTKIDNYGFEKVVVTWTGISHLNYTLRYYLGDKAFSVLPESEYSGAPSEGWGGELKAIALPLVGGATSVDITAAWDYGTAEYYPSVTAATHEIEATATLLPKVEGFWVDTTTAGSYTLTWNATLGATSYEIWKSELTGRSGYNAEDGTLAIGAWTAVSGTPTKNGDKYTLDYTESDTSKTWVYAIIAKSATARSAGVSTTTAYAIALTLPQVNNFSVDTTAGSYKLAWDATEGATEYEIKKAYRTGEYDEANDTYPHSAWTAVSGTPTRNGNRYTLDYTESDTSKTWIYEIVAKSATAKSSSPRQTTAKPVLPVLATVSGFRVTPAATGIYTLVWKATPGATAYDIWKAEKTGQLNAANGNEALYSAWTAVEGARTRNGDDYKLVYTESDTSKIWVYEIVARDSAASSISKAQDTADAQTSTIATTFSASNIAETKDADGKPQVTITVTASAGETVALYRATYDNTSGPTAVTGEYTALPAASKTTVGALNTWIDTPTIRASYAYKLIVTRGEYTKESDPVTLTSGSYTPTLNSISVTASADSSHVYSINVQLSGGGSYTDDLKADIYQATVENGGYQTPPKTGWQKITTTPLTYEALSTDGHIQTAGLTVGVYYVYRIVLTSTENSTQQLYNTSVTTYGVRPSVVNTSYISDVSKRTAGSSTSVVQVYGQNNTSPATEADSYKLLNGAEVFVVNNDTGTYIPVTTLSAFTKATKDGALNGVVDPYYYYATIATATLNNLNSGPTAKTYSLAVKDVSGGYATFGNSFSVASGVVSNWP